MSHRSSKGLLALDTRLQLHLKAYRANAVDAVMKTDTRWDLTPPDAQEKVPLGLGV